MEHGTQVYKTRIDNLRQAILKCKNEALKDELNQALLHTVLARDTFVSLSEQLPKLSQYLKDQDIEKNRVMEHLNRNLATIESTATDVGSPQISEQLTLSSEVLREGIRNLEKHWIMVRLIENKMWHEAYRMIDSTLFHEILPANNPESARNAVIKLLDFLVGLTPIGPFKDGIEKIRSMGSAQGEGFNEANSYMNQLDEYSSACYRWCIAAQLFIDAIEHIGEKRPTLVEDAVRCVEARRERLSRTENID